MEEIINSQNEEVRQKPRISMTLILVSLLVFSIATNIFLFSKVSNSSTISGQTFKFIEPSKNVLIDTNVQENPTILHYSGLREILESEIKNHDAEGKIGIFIQDTGTGSWLGINEREGYTPASLLKIPIMIATLKKVDREEIKLDDKITILKEDIDELYALNTEELEAGQEITVLKLLERMIAFSDNTAKNALKRQLTIEEIDAVFVHIGIPNPYLLKNDPTVSTRGYIRLFKALYYSSYLSPELSEMALDLTTDTQEENLISKGVPPQIQVAHKFGVVEGNSLHDCGIVYHQKNPYFLCIMTNNLTLEKSSDLIYSISKDTYEFIDSKN